MQNETPKRPPMAVLFAQEKAFYNYILANSECLHQLIPPKFDEIQEKGDPSPRLRPLPYIRWIGKLNQGRTAKAKELLASLHQLYREITNTDEKTPFPHRFARFYDDVEQINLHFHDAVKSWRLKTDGELYTAIMPEPELKDWIKIHFVDVRGAGEHRIAEETAQMMAAAKKLTDFGIKSQAYQYSRAYQGIVEIWLYVQAASLYHYYSTSHIQAQQITGTRYNSTIRHTGSNRSKRGTFGFMLIDENSPITPEGIYISAPQGPRAHSLANQGLELPWPQDIVELRFKMYDRSRA